MSEQEQTKQETEQAPVEPKQEEKAASLSKQEFEAIEKEVEAQDKELVDQLRSEFNKRLQEEIGSIKQKTEEEFTNRLSDYKKQIDESYAKRFDEIKTEVEELKPRKGLVDTSDVASQKSPYRELGKEAQPADNQDDYSINTLVADRMKDVQVGEAFLNSLKR